MILASGSRLDVLSILNCKRPRVRIPVRPDLSFASAVCVFKDLRAPLILLLAVTDLISALVRLLRRDTNRLVETARGLILVRCSN